MKQTIYFILATGLLSTAVSQASLVISSLNSTSTIDFSGFDGSGFAPTPSTGQLDSDTWRVTGLSDGAGTFGGTHTTGDFARGSSSGGVTTGGIYAFVVASGNTGLGVQGAGSDFTPGTITLRIQNNTGGSVSSWNLAYNLFVLNDQGRSNSFDWAWSTDDSSYTSLSTYTSVEAADSSPAWVNVQSNSFTNVSATVANGDSLYLRWSSDDVGGGGSRDEFAIGDVSITAVPEPSAALLGGLVFIALLRRRR